MPEPQENQSPSTNQNQENTSSSNQPTPSNTPLPNLYRHIIDCPLRAFIDCTVDGNLYALTIKGFPSPEELEEAKSNLISEYGDAIGDSETKMYVELLKEVTILDIDYKTVQLIVPLLKNVYIKYMADDLNEIINHSPRFAFDFNDYEQYVKDLDRCVNRSKSMLIAYQMKKSQLDAITERNQNNAKPDREYYYNILYTLEDHAGRTLGDGISVHQFVTRIRKFNEYCNRKNNKK